MSYQILEKSSSKKDKTRTSVRWLVWGLSWTYNNLCSFSGFRMSRHERCNLLIENFPFEQLAKPCPVCEAAGAHGVLGGSHPHSTGMFQQWTRFLFPWCSFLWYIHLSPIYPSSYLAPNSAPQLHLHIGLPFGTSIPCLQLEQVMIRLGTFSPTLRVVSFTIAVHEGTTKLFPVFFKIVLLFTFFLLPFYFLPFPLRYFTPPSHLHIGCHFETPFRVCRHRR